MKYAVFDEYGDYWPETISDTEQGAIKSGLKIIKRADPKSDWLNMLPRITFDSWDQMKSYGLRVCRLSEDKN